MIIRDNKGRFMKGSFFKRIKTGKYINCDYCNKSFYIFPSSSKYRSARFCSSKCYWNSNKGEYPSRIPKDSWKKALLKNKRNGLYKRHAKRMKDGGALRARLANKCAPNKPEKILIQLIKKNNLPFNYVGDGKIWFSGKTQMFNPDFLSKNPKHIMELFGDYWHINTKEKDKERLNTYKRYGYRTLVIWEYELKDLNMVLNKIGEFAHARA